MHVDNSSRDRCNKFNFQGDGTKWVFGHRAEKHICLKAQIVQKILLLWKIVGRKVVWERTNYR